MYPTVGSPGIDSKSTWHKFRNTNREAFAPCPSVVVKYKARPTLTLESQLYDGRDDQRYWAREALAVRQDRRSRARARRAAAGGTLRAG
jgi:hypothetical protein